MLVVFQELIFVMNNFYLPNVAVRFYDISEQDTGGYKAVEGKTTAYLCKKSTCLPPVTDVNKFISILISENDIDVFT